MAERFEISEVELVRDLEQAAMCGLPPFLDEVVDLYIDDDGHRARRRSRASSRSHCG
jgi:hypothetical protein